MRSLSLMLSAIFLFLLPTRSVSPQEIPQIITPSLEASSGVYIQEVPTSSIFYTSVAPLIYEFKVPNWSPDEIILNCTTPLEGNGSKTNLFGACSDLASLDCRRRLKCKWDRGRCVEKDKALPTLNNSLTCATTFNVYLDKVQSRFSEYLFNNRPLLHRFIQMGATPQVSDILFECHKLGRHFPDIYVDQGVMNRYLEKLKGCSPAGDMEFFHHINNFAYNISTVYHEMSRGFHDEVWAEGGDQRVDVGLWSNAQSAINSLNFLNYHVELNRWHLALSDCEAGRIPASLVTPELIGDSLQDLFEILEKSNFQPVISGSDVGNYFKNPLTDCTFTNDSLVVRVLVPVIAKDHSYSLYSIHPGTFYDPTFDRFCQLEISSDVFLLDNLERVAYSTSCTRNEFCHAPNSGLRGRVDPCASALLNDDWEDVLEYCPYSCYSLTKYHKRTSADRAPLSVIQRDPTTWLVTGNSVLGNRITVSCSTLQGTSSILVEMKKGIIKGAGAVEVGLPCGCILTVGVGLGVNNYTQNPPCIEVGPKLPQFRQIVPFHWVRGALSKLKGLSASSSYFKISEDDLILGKRKDDEVVHSEYSDEKTGERSNENGVGMLVLIISCVLITLAVGFLIGIVIQRRTPIFTNLLDSCKIPDPVTYQNMERDL